MIQSNIESNNNGEIIHNINANPHNIIPIENQSKTIIIKNIVSNLTEQSLTTIFNKFGKVSDVKIFKPQNSSACATVTFEDQEEFDNIIKYNDKISKNQSIILFDNEKLLLLINEDIDKVKRNVDKMNRPEHLAKQLQRGPDDMQLHMHFLLSNHILSFMAQSIRVREIWVGNLPGDITQPLIMGIFSKYGKIDNCNLYLRVNQTQNFAFLKFETTDSATKAINEQDQLSVILKANLRMSFADFLKRQHIVGDSPNYNTSNENLTNIICVLFNPNISIPKVEIIKERFSIFGKVKNILCRPSINEQLKSYFLVEMETVEQAKRARKYYNQDDKDTRKKYKLGDNKCEVNILIKPRISATLYDLILPYLPKINTENIENPFLNNISNNKSPVNYNFFWSGFFIKSKKLQVGVDAFLVYGNEKELLKENLINLFMNHKATYEELKALKIEPKGVVIFKASNETQISKFNLFIDYLKHKNIVGVINQIEGQLIYLIPFNQVSKQYVHDCDVNDLVGVFMSTGAKKKEQSNNPNN